MQSSLTKYFPKFIICGPVKKKKSLTFTASECDAFFCHATRQCLPWSKVCDGRLDCEYLSDEGGLCSKSCSRDNGGCSQICRKSPQGSRCLCQKGYR